MDRFIRRWFPRSHRMAHWCEVYHNTVHAEGSCDMEINGEEGLTKSVLPDCKTLFDVGANRGEFSAQALKASPELVIHSFEPDPSLYQKLSRWESEQDSVRSFQFAIGQKNGNATFRSYGKGSELGSLYQRKGADESQYEEEFEVEVRTLDAHAKAEKIDRIDYLKIDVEGGEMDVMEGASELLSSGAIGWVHFEYGPGWLGARRFLVDAFDLASENGYAVYLLRRDGLLRLKEYEQKRDNFRTKYFVLTRDTETADRMASQGF